MLVAAVLGARRWLLALAGGGWRWLAVAGGACSRDSAWRLGVEDGVEDGVEERVEDGVEAGVEDGVEYARGAYT